MSSAIAGIGSGARARATATTPPKDHIVYGGTYRAESGGNGARLANIMISDKPEGARFALIRADAPVPKGHPETRRPPK